MNTARSLITLLPLLLAGCVSPGKRELDSVIWPDVSFRQEPVTNVVARMNEFLAASYSKAVPPRIVFDDSIPPVTRATGSPLFEQERARCAERLIQKNASTNLQPITLRAHNASIWQLLEVLPKIEPRLRVEPSPSGAVIELAIPDGLECRAYPAEPESYDEDGNPHPLSAEDMAQSARGLEACVPSYASITYSHPLRAFLLIAAPADHKEFGKFFYATKGRFRQ